MKKTHFIDLLHTIKKTMVSFVSIFIFMCLGIAIFNGIGWSGISLGLSYGSDLDDNQYRAFEIVYPYGFEKDIVEEVRGLEGVGYAEGIYYSDQFFEHNNTRFQAKVIMISENIDRLYQIEGTLPEETSEIAVEKNWALNNDMHLGDTVIFRYDADDPHLFNAVLEEDLDKLNEKYIPESGMQHLESDRFTVTALVESPAYLSRYPLSYGTSPESGVPYNCIMFLPETSFDPVSYAGYPSMLVYSDELKNASFGSEEYKKAEEKLKSAIKPTIDRYVDKRTKRVLNSVNVIVKKAEKKLADALNEIAKSEKDIAYGEDSCKKAKKEIEETEKFLDESQKELDQKRKNLEESLDKITVSSIELNNAISQIETYEQKIERGYAGLAEAEDRLGQLKGMVDDSETIKQITWESLSRLKEYYEILEMSGTATDEELEKLQSEIKALEKIYNETDAKTRNFKETYEAVSNGIGYTKAELINGIEDLKAQKEKLIAGTGELSAFEQSMKKTEEELDGLQSEIDSGRNELEEGKKELEKNINKINEGKKKLIKGKKDYEKARKDFEEIRNTADQMEAAKCAFIAKNENGGICSSEQLIGIFEKLKLSMALLFVIVGLLVCYSAVSRLVFEQKKQIGTKKALGMTKKESALFYLVYAGAATLLGGIAGVLFGRFIFEPVILSILKKNFVFVSTVYHFEWTDAVVTVLAELALVLLVAAMASLRLNREKPVLLLTGEEVSRSRSRYYEKTKLWERISLYKKTIINNCFNDKRRVFATLVGVCGCTSLIICAITIYNSISDSFGLQYSRLQHFDAIVYYDSDNKGAGENIEGILKDNNIEFAKAYTTLGRIKRKNNSFLTTFIFASDDEKFNDMICLHQNGVKSGDIKDGLWVNISYKKAAKAEPGDTIIVSDTQGVKRDLEIRGFYDYYLSGNQLVMTKEYLEDNTGFRMGYNAFLLNTKLSGYENIKKALNKTDGFISIKNFYKDSSQLFMSVGSALNAVIAIYFILALVMAFLVLLNLFTMFVNEKKNELIVLRINGFPLKETKKYIYTDTVFLGITGIILGIILGIIIGNATIDSLSSGASYFLHEISWAACGIGAVLSAALTALMSWAAVKKIKKFKLTDINNR